MTVYTEAIAAALITLAVTTYECVLFGVVAAQVYTWFGASVTSGALVLVMIRLGATPMRDTSTNLRESAHFQAARAVGFTFLMGCVFLAGFITHTLFWETP